MSEHKEELHSRPFSGCAHYVFDRNGRSCVLIVVVGVVKITSHTTGFFLCVSLFFALKFSKFVRVSISDQN